MFILGIIIPCRYSAKGSIRIPVEINKVCFPLSLVSHKYIGISDRHTERPFRVVGVSTCAKKFIHTDSIFQNTFFVTAKQDTRRSFPLGKILLRKFDPPNQTTMSYL